MDNKLHVHNDIKEAQKWFKIPIAFAFGGDDVVYIMQEDRCVFVGNSQIAEKWIEMNDGKYCKSIFPLI
jgi:hypothetical protein